MIEFVAGVLVMIGAHHITDDHRHNKRPRKNHAQQIRHHHSVDHGQQMRLIVHDHADGETEHYHYIDS